MSAATAEKLFFTHPDCADLPPLQGSLDNRLRDRLAGAPSQKPHKLSIDPERLEKDLAKLVLVLVELVRRLMEAQAVHRMERETLSEAEAERLGSALLAAKTRIEELRVAFGIEHEDFNLDLGPLGKLL